jgi:hypothetical protein
VDERQILVILFCSVAVTLGDDAEVLAGIRADAATYARPWAHNADSAVYGLTVDRVEQVSHYHISSNGEGRGL